MSSETPTPSSGFSQVLRDVSWREVMPWLHLFRAFRIAMQPSKLALAWVLLMGLYMGGRVMDGVWGRFWPEYTPAAELRIDRYLSFAPYSNDIIERDTTTMVHEGIFIKFFKFEVGQVAQLSKAVVAGDWVNGPESVVAAVVNFVVLGPRWLFVTHPVYAVIFTLWFLLLWAIFGGALTRIAAVHVAREETMSVRQSLRFSSGKMMSYIFAPLIPLILLTLLAAVLGVCGWVLLHVPYVGPVVVGAMLFLGLLIGAVLTLLLLGAVGGFNLMYPTIAVEGSDSFDAISRSFSYVYARPWKMLFYTVVSVAYGALCYLFVRFFIFLTLSLTRYFIGWWLMGDKAVQWEQTLWPPVRYWDLSYPVPLSTMNAGDKTAAWLVAFWVYLVISMLGAFAISFYFSSSTIVYALLRREVDATDIDDVYVEESDEEFSEAPPAVAEKVVGTAGPLAGPAVVPPVEGTPRATPTNE